MKLYKFYADWCVPCKQQSRLLENFNMPMISVDVDSEENQDLVSKYGVRGLPTLIFVDNDLEIGRFSGLTTRDTLQKFIDNYNEKARKLN